MAPLPPTIPIAKRRMLQASMAVDRAEDKLAHAEARLRRRVVEAHTAGMTWEDLGTFFATTRQAVWKRFTIDDDAA